MYALVHGTVNGPPINMVLVVVKLTEVIKGWSLKNLTKCSALKMFTKSVENGNKKTDIFFLCPLGKK